MNRGVGGLLLVALALASCARTQVGFTPDEARFTARWIEDVATGLNRRPGELHLRPSSREMAGVSALLAHGTSSGHWTPVTPLDARRLRRAKLDKLLANGAVLVDGDAGLVGPAPGLPPEVAPTVSRLADGENQDRRLVDALVLGRARAVGEAEEVYLATVRNERTLRDLAAGGKLGQRQRSSF